jgi:general L-amino acid transport system substrate-binding protein
MHKGGFTMRGRRIRVPALMLLLLLTAAACTNDDGGTNQATTRSVLDTVKSRGRLVCGVNNQVPGFGFVDTQGNFSGFDVEFCKALAAAVLGDATKVDFKALTTEQRFTALQAREVDVLIRNTTWTATRDGSNGAAFTTPTFYDGQGMMVRADSNLRDIEDLDGATICVSRATTTELNLEAQFAARNIDYRPLATAGPDENRAAFIARRCQGWTSDKSQLAGVRSNWPANQGGPRALRILEETLSKEPLAPVIRDGDSKWFDAVNWAVIATIQAEEFGITKANVDQMRNSQNPEIRRFLGVALPAAASPSPGSPTPSPAPFDAGLGLPTDFAYQIVKQVGNYEEIYNRTVGPATALGLARDVNNLWTENGLLYAPPYR